VKLAVIAVGRLKRGVEAELCARYIDRINAQGRSQAIAPVAITELSESPAPGTTDRKNAEAADLIRRIPAQSYVMALDEHGKSHSSIEFATMLARIRDDGASDLVFVIGGPDGHGEALTSMADQTMAFGPMTLPHGLARVLLLEQLYRAITILEGHPYHRF